jgi:hypothetical protein
MFATIGIRHFTRNKSRLFQTIWLAVHITDAMAIAGLIVRGKLDLVRDSQSMAFSCKVLPLEILMPIVHPMKLTVANTTIDNILIDVKVCGSVNFSGSHNISAFTEMHFKLISTVYLRFYEQHRPHIQAIYGTDTKKWPPLLQFA